jgi:uncharacterized protein
MRESVAGISCGTGRAQPAGVLSRDCGQARRAICPLAATATAAALTILIASPLAAQPAYPAAHGHVNDFAGVLDEGSRNALETLLVALEADTTAEVAVATVSSLGGISVDEYATGMFNAWGVGQADKDNGVLILVAPAERDIRIEVGYGLEGVIPDGLAGSIIRSEFIPAFRDGNYQAGIVAGVGRIATIVRRGEKVTPQQLQALARQEVSTRPSLMPPWAIIGVFGFVVALGGYMIGVGGGSRVISIIVVGGLVAAFGLVMYWLYALAGFAFLAIVLAGTAWLGAKKGRSQPIRTRVRGKAQHDAGWIVTDTSAVSSDGGGGGGSDSSSDSSDSFGGGSSGGGGASDSW